MENILKVNLYVDGNYLYHIANYIQYGVDEGYRSVIDWGRLISYLLSFLQDKEGQRCAVNVKKYFIGSGAGYDERRQGFYNAIEYAGIQRISFPLKSAVAQNGRIGLKEDAVDTLFTFTASKDFYSVSREDRPDIICIAAGDSDYIPLVEGLKSEGARIACMYFDFTSTTSTTRASQLLLEKSDYIINLETLLK
ncbi:MAG: NYN domain-containing protein, partial [Treponemataceae bacterium]|nr:NYN domain-containing protein [Treponemataceae bacterium]